LPASDPGVRPLLIAGLVIGVASYLLGIWFGTELLVVH
jgi:hypothetical protein